MAAMPILAVGADPAWRARLRRLFALRAELQWLGGYASGESRPAGREPPSVLLLDGDDARVERERRRPNLPAPVRLYFFRHPDAAALQTCLRVGARGCLDKQLSADAMLRAVAASSSGLFVMAPSLLVEVLRAGDAMAADDRGAPEVHGARWYGLTERQRQIVDCVADGLSNKEIARRLQISPETVKTHLQKVFEHEGVHGRMALLAAVQR
ncbi:MAG TPA: response regulator transcription factor [Thermomonas sp.]|nr:response regulator transcription factor [Thermomonas sp.]